MTDNQSQNIYKQLPAQDGMSMKAWCKKHGINYRAYNQLSNGVTCMFSSDNIRPIAQVMARHGVDLAEIAKSEDSNE